MTVMNRKHIRREEQQRSGVSKSAKVCTCNQSWFKKVKKMMEFCSCRCRLLVIRSSLQSYILYKAL